MKTKTGLKYVLYFGRDIQGRGSVTDAQVKSFLKDVVTPIFPSFTVQDVIGYWKGSPEKSFTLTIIEEEEQGYNIKSIVNVYKTLYKQESVLVECSKVFTMLL